MAKLTELETKVMASIPRDDFYEERLESTLWNDCFIDNVNRCYGIEGKQTRALLVSLAKKDMLYLDGGKDGYLSLTVQGKQWLVENNVVDAEGYRNKGYKLA